MGPILAILAAAGFIVMLRVLLVLASRPPESRRNRVQPPSPITVTLDPTKHTP